MELPQRFIKRGSPSPPAQLCRGAVSCPLWHTQSDYYLAPSQTEIITSVSDGEAGRAQQLYFPAQPRRMRSHHILLTIPWLLRKDDLSQSARSVSVAAAGPSVTAGRDGGPFCSFACDWRRLDEAVPIAGLFISSAVQCPPHLYFVFDIWHYQIKKTI